MVVLKQGAAAVAAVVPLSGGERRCLLELLYCGVPVILSAQRYLCNTNVHRLMSLAKACLTA